MPGARILLVEDDEALRSLLVRNLQARGHEVHVAGDTQTALAHLRAAPIDLVVLDINLPDQTGWELMRIARERGWLRTQAFKDNLPCFPVVVLSAVQISPRRLAEFRPLAHLPKPFPLESLLRLAAEAAQRRTGGAATGQQDAEGTLSPSPDEEGSHA